MYILVCLTPREKVSRIDIILGIYNSPLSLTYSCTHILIAQNETHEIRSFYSWTAGFGQMMSRLSTNDTAGRRFPYKESFECGF